MLRGARKFAIAGAIAVGLSIAGPGLSSWATDPVPTDGGTVTVADNSDTTQTDCDPTTPGIKCPVNTVKKVGGGTWNYGSKFYATGGQAKACWSDYVHNTKYHSATAIIGSNNIKTFNTARNWADSYTDHNSIADTCHAFWSTY